ncbi:peptidylprolyl isomerase [Roseateles violae]|uniref:peptidylprolyl isomerase n=1 Tax=Roseateles violae TaxID=3058042 RepID=A0ABT8DQB1_9BURK|nr:peptidylprolyl isomerase [Pelomonas sp. PFR6]MDN3920183.1 peptidylprolyl isomerase [Pelomonas sp. PFR6]
MPKKTPLISALLALGLSAAIAAPAKKPAAPAKPKKTSAELIAAAPDGDWRALDPGNTLLMELPAGPVLIELAPRFAPRHVANIRALARGGFWDGLAVLRVQDNFVAQWGDPDGDDAAKARPLGKAEAKIPAEFSVPLKGLPLTRLPDVDGWAPRSGFVDGFPVAADPKTGRAWLAHCYGMVGAGRGNEVDSSTGAELYAVIGHAPRGLDLNITVVGRVIKGIELLSSLPRGGSNMGFYDKPEQRLAIKQIRLLADMPEAERPALQILRTDSATWTQLLDARRHRGGWFVHSPAHTEICSAGVPSRPVPGSAAKPQ